MRGGTPSAWPARVAAVRSGITRLNVALADHEAARVDAQADGSRYADASRYLRSLIRCDRERAEKVAGMQQLIEEGRASGVSDERMADIRKRETGQLRPTT